MCCFSIWHCGVRTIDYFLSPFPSYVLCFSVAGTLPYAASRDNIILYAEGRWHFGFLATYYLYSLGLFGEAPSGDIWFDTYMCGWSSRNILRSYSSIGPRICHSSSQFCQRHWAQKTLLYMHPGGFIESGSKSKHLIRRTIIYQVIWFEYNIQEIVEAPNHRPVVVYNSVVSTTLSKKLY